MRFPTPLRYVVLAFVLAAILVPQPLVSQASSQAPLPSTNTPTTSNTSKPDADKANCSNNGTYVNSKGETVRRPENCSTAPKGATAQCRDGSYSFSQSRRGTCSHHGGVAKWLSN